MLEIITNNSLLPNTTTTDSDSVTHELTLAVAKWVLGLIIIVGLVTNSLTLIILSRRKIGSQTTRIILLFLAATDLTIMVVELFLHYIPMHWRWFPIFYTDLSCGFAFWIQASTTTASAWYLMLMTMERFTVVYFPMRAKLICTKRKILIASILIPIVSFCCYCYHIVGVQVVPSEEYDYMECKPKSQDPKVFKSKILSWIVLYFFIPAITIVVLNAAIVIRLSQAHKIQQQMTRNGSSPAAAKNGGSIKSRITRTLNRTSSAQSSSSQSIRKATTLVITASVAFVLMMIPRGVSTTLSLDIDWDYEDQPRFILDHVAYLLQYLNHAINFFLYLLANNTFRKEMRHTLRCGRKRGEELIRLRAHTYADTDVTQTTYVRTPSRVRRYHSFTEVDEGTGLVETQLVQAT